MYAGSCAVMNRRCVHEGRLMFKIKNQERLPNRNIPFVFAVCNRNHKSNRQSSRTLTGNQLISCELVGKF